MPLTFFAHQGPFLPIQRRWPKAVDGVALVIGSMAPDMAYVLSGSRFAVWAHGFPGVITSCLPATFAASWLVVRVMAPVVPDHLPDLGPFHVHDYRGLATHRFHFVRFVVWAELGALSHVFLDEFTHNWGWFAHHVSWYDNRIVDRELLGREWTVYRVFQYIGHVGFTALCIALLWAYGRRRWMRARAATIAPSPTTAASYARLWGLSALGLGAATLWLALDRVDSAIAVLRLSFGLFGGMLAGSLAVPAFLLPGNDDRARSRGDARHAP
jgi:hypothetical protein